MPDPQVKPTIMVTGGKGLVGSKFIEMFSSKYSFVELDLSHPTSPVDITNEQQVSQLCNSTKAQALVHFAAFTNVTEAWKQNGDKNGSAYLVNVNGTRNIARACAQSGIHLIHISTAYVFDGHKSGMYTEADATSPIEWYGQTKAEAELEVQQLATDWSILRIDQPFRFDSQARPDIVHKIISGLKAGNLYPQFTDHYFGPTVIEDFARVIDLVIRRKLVGLFHATSGEKWSDFDFACAIERHLNPNSRAVKPGSLDTYLKSLDRPYQRNTALDCTKLKHEVDFSPLTIAQALAQVQVE